MAVLYSKFLISLKKRKENCEVLRKVTCEPTPKGIIKQFRGLFVPDVYKDAPANFDWMLDEHARCVPGGGDWCSGIDCRSCIFAKYNAKERKAFYELCTEPVQKGEQTEMHKDVQKCIETKCDELKQMLIEKNRKYGNSALNPVRIFSKADDLEQLKVRMDDKLNRIKNQTSDEDEDVIKDLAGYCILYMIKQDELKGKE